MTAQNAVAAASLGVENLSANADLSSEQQHEIERIVAELQTGTITVTQARAQISSILAGQLQAATQQAQPKTVQPAPEPPPPPPEFVSAYTQAGFKNIEGQPPLVNVAA